jgi:hypothetical protein
MTKRRHLIRQIAKGGGKAMPSSCPWTKEVTGEGRSAAIAAAIVIRKPTTMTLRIDPAMYAAAG